MPEVDPRLNEIKDCLYRVATKIIIVHDSKILVVKEKEDDYWNLPGGGVDHGEEILPSLYRELEEEIAVKKEQIQSLDGPLLFSIGGVVDGIPRLEIIYKAVIDPSIPDLGPDVEEIRWLTAEELRKIVLNESVTKALDDIISVANL